MQSNNDQSAYFGIALVGVGLLFLWAFAFALLAFIALALTIVAFCAWFRPIQLFGETIIPEEAHDFVRRGFIGAVALPLFAVFAAKLFGTHINPDWLGYIVLGGYSFGSVVVSYCIETEKAEAAARAQQLQMLAPPSVPPKATDIQLAPWHGEPITARSDPPPFRFATWDDEEELRK